MSKRSASVVKVGALVGVLATSIGCAHVKRDELALELSRVEGDLRAEYQAGDRELAGRLDGVDQRVARLDDSVDTLDARTARLESDLLALATEFQTTVERIDGALAFNVPVHFGYDSAQLRHEDTPILDRFASVLAESYPDRLITVEGFTDPAGSPAYNLRLGQSRADSVLEYLAERGLSRDRLRSVSYGEDVARLIDPDASGPGAAGLANRRVTLVVETTGSAWNTNEPATVVDDDVVLDDGYEETDGKAIDELEETVGDSADQATPR